FIFFNDTSPPEIYTLSLHDALPISQPGGRLDHLLVEQVVGGRALQRHPPRQHAHGGRPPKRVAVHALEELVQPLAARPRRLHAQDRKSTRLNSSHVAISYAVFCLKK